MGYSTLERHYTPQEVADQFFRCHVNRIYELMDEGKLAFVERDLSTEKDRKRRRELKKDEPKEERKRKLIPESAVRSMMESWSRSGDDRAEHTTVATAPTPRRGRPAKRSSKPNW